MLARAKTWFYKFLKNKVSVWTHFVAFIKYDLDDLKENVLMYDCNFKKNLRLDMVFWESLNLRTATKILKLYMDSFQFLGKFSLPHWKLEWMKTMKLFNGNTVSGYVSLFFLPFPISISMLEPSSYLKKKGYIAPWIMNKVWSYFTNNT